MLTAPRICWTANDSLSVRQRDSVGNLKEGVIDFRILGPLEVLVDGRAVAPRASKQRTLLAILLLHANAPVSVDALVEALWGERPPQTVRTALQGHVSALRRPLGADRIDTQAPGYLLRLEPGELDAERFEVLIAEARGVGDAAERSKRLASAVALWRGAALADFRYADFAQADIARLEERRLTAIEDRLDADLVLGRHTELLAELEQRVAEQPLRERLRGQLMLALYRGGRQGDALHAFQQARRVLAEEIGIDPGPALLALQRQILAQDPALDPPRAVEPVAPRQERKRVTVLVAELSGPSDPEELDRALAPALARATELLLGFGASVQPRFANALLAVFGAPRAHEDDPERALRGGEALRRALRPGGALTVRVGIETGQALVTVDGGRVEVTGGVVAAASRLQATAPDGGLAIGDALRRLAVRPDHRHDVPFVGRDHELGLLERTYERAVAEASVQLVTVAGEPGSGKTRLVLELRALLEHGEPHDWLRGRCLPYGEVGMFWALGEIVKARTGILESDGAETSARKLAAALTALIPEGDDRRWLEETLAPLVGLAGAISTLDQSYAGWRRFLESIAEHQPLVL